jgi:hypothetical protein
LLRFCGHKHDYLCMFDSSHPKEKALQSKQKKQNVHEHEGMKAQILYNCLGTEC